MVANHPDLPAITGSAVPVAPPQPVFHVYIRDMNRNLVQISLDPPPTVQDFIHDIIEEFAEDGEEYDVFGEPADLYLSTVGGRILPMAAILDTVVASGQTVVLHRRLRGGMQSGNWFTISLIY